MGSTFTLTVPLRCAAAPAAPAVGAARRRRGRGGGAGPARGPRGRRRLVLAIDDDPDVVLLLKENLADAGYRVVGAANGAEGLRLARELKPSAITLDIVMPGADGWQVLHALKADPATRDIPVLLLTVVDQKDLGLPARRRRLSPEAVRARRSDRRPAAGRAESAGACWWSTTIPHVADLVRQSLEDEPYQIDVAGDGQAALEAIAERPPGRHPARSADAADGRLRGHRRAAEGPRATRRFR